MIDGSEKRKRQLVFELQSSPVYEKRSKFGLSSEFFDKIPVRILLDVLFRVFRFSKASFCALTSSFMTF